MKVTTKRAPVAAGRGRQTWKSKLLNRQKYRVHIIIIIIDVVSEIVNVNFAYLAAAKSRVLRVDNTIYGTFNTRRKS